MSVTAQAQRNFSALEELGFALTNYVLAKYHLPEDADFMTVHDEATGLDFDLRRKGRKIFVTLHKDRTPPARARRAPAPPRRAPAPPKADEEDEVVMDADEEDDAKDWIDELVMDAVKAEEKKEIRTEKPKRSVSVVPRTEPMPVKRMISKRVTRAIRAYDTSETDVCEIMQRIIIDIQNNDNELIDIDCIVAIYKAIEHMEHKYIIEFPPGCEDFASLWSEFVMVVSIFVLTGFETADCEDCEDYGNETA